jgi:two-component system, sensor histidine kinase and response regulator
MIPLVSTARRQLETEGSSDAVVCASLSKPIHRDSLYVCLREHCLAVGMDSYLAKPVSKDVLLASRPVLDAEIVGRLERLGEAVGEDLMGQLAVLFLADAESHVALLRQAGGNTATLVRSAHSLRGASANLGATELAYLCASLETVAGTGALESARALIDAIDVELGRVRSALAAIASASSTTG